MGNDFVYVVKLPNGLEVFARYLKETNKIQIKYVLNGEKVGQYEEFDLAKKTLYDIIYSKLVEVGQM